MNLEQLAHHLDEQEDGTYLILSGGSLFLRKRGMDFGQWLMVYPDGYYHTEALNHSIAQILYRSERDGRVWCLS